VVHLKEGESLIQLFARVLLVCHDGHLEVRQP